MVFFLTRSNPHSSLPALSKLFISTSQPRPSCPLSSATETNTPLLNFSLYIPQRLGDGNALFTEFQASAVDVIANLFDRQLGNELMMAFRPALRLNRHSSSSLPDMLTFNALDSGSSASWPQRGRREGEKGKKKSTLTSKQKSPVGLDDFFSV